MKLHSLFGRTATTLLMLSLAACGGGGDDSSPSSFTISGTVTGLAAGTQIVLNDNGNDPLTVNANAAFTFIKPVDANGAYLVTITTQPTGQTCSAANFQGAGVTANVTSVKVTCSNVTHTVAGSVTGLTVGQSVVLNNNGADPTTVGADGAFAFAVPVAFNGSYAVTVGTQPTGQMCTVSNGSGSGVVANISNVAVTCSTNTYTIGGAVTGLAAGQQVTLNNNTIDPLTINADGTFTFPTAVAFNGGYAVTVGTQPTGQMCTVSNGSGAGVVAGITNVAVTCSTNTYAIGGAVTGLIAGQQVTLNNNAGDPLTVNADGAFTFPAAVTFNGSYAVTVGTQPVNQTCSVTNGSGGGVVANITNVTVTCSANTYSVSGAVSGLLAGQQVTLNNNAADPTTIAANGAFAFSTPVAFNSGYLVTVGTQPTNQTCTVSNQNGTVAGPVTNVTVTCSPNSYTISGTVSGLVSTQQVTLNNNGADPVVVNADSSFSFTTPVAYTAGYAVSVGTQPTGETCRVTAGSGSNVSANVNTVLVTCRLALAYVVNSTAATISQYTIGLDGALTEFGMPITTGGTDPNVVTVDPMGRFAYVTNFGSNTVAQFSINAATGALLPLGLPVPSEGVKPYSVAVTDKYVYVTNQDDPHGATNNVAQFKIGLDGTLTRIGSGSVPLLPGSVPYQITVDRDGKHAYVANKFSGAEAGTGSIAQFDIDAATGALTPMTPAQVSSGDNWSIGIAVNGTFAYVTNFGASTVSQFSIDPLTGSLPATPVNTQTTEANPYPIAISADGQFAYWANKSSSSISQCTINPDGSLRSGCGRNTNGTGNRPQYVAIDPFSRHVYVVNFADSGLVNGQGTTLNQYNIDKTAGPTFGNVTSISGAVTVPTGLGPFSITTTR